MTDRNRRVFGRVIGHGVRGLAGSLPPLFERISLMGIRRKNQKKFDKPNWKPRGGSQKGDKKK